jgi:CHASE1-domain containing sensor protein
MVVKPPGKHFGKSRQLIPCMLAAFIGIGVSVIAAGLTASWENKHAEAQFKAVAENHYMVVQNGLNEYVNRLRAVRALFDSSEGQVTRK